MVGLGRRVTSELGRRVRYATMDDAVTIAHLNQHVHVDHAQAEPDDFVALDPADAVEFFASLLEDRANVLLLSEDADGQAVGYVWAHDQQRPGNPFTKPARTMYIHHVAVAPGARGQGIGKSLVTAVEAEARDRGISRIALDHWTFNETARNFFFSLGFKPYNTRMRRRLDAEAEEVR